MTNDALLTHWAPLYLLHILVSGALALLFYLFKRRYQRPYLGLLALSMSALSIYLICTFSLVALGLTAAAQSHSYLRHGLSAMSLICAGLQLIWLLLGIGEMAAGRPIWPGWRTRLVWLAIVVGVALTLPYAFDPDAGTQRHMLRVTVRFAATGVAFAVAAWLLWRRPLSLGSALVASALSLVALQSVLLAVAGRLPLTEVSLAFIKNFNLIELFSLFLLGIGLVIWLLERERQLALQAQARAAYLDSHDPVTQIANRNHLLKCCDDLVVAGESFGILVIDLSRFKMINDSVGIREADRLLGVIARRLARICGPSAPVARIGGDVFAVMSRINTLDQLAALATQLRQVLRGGVQVGDHLVPLDATVGSAVFPRDGQNGLTVLENANLALSVAKQQEQRYAPFKPGMQQRDYRELGLAAELKQALERDQLVLHYQPKLDLRLGRFTSAEALVRWQHPERGLLPPGAFLAAIQQFGLETALDKWVLEAACRFMQRHQLADRGLSIAVNISASQLQSPDLSQQLCDLLTRHQLPAHCLQLEITEETAMQDLEMGLNTLQQLRQLGVDVAIDDFGTGYSSLRYLHRLPVNEVKIDRSFIAELGREDGDSVIVKAIRDIARHMGMRTTAEGVETRQQLDYLQHLGVDIAQGYFVGRPVPGEELIARLSTPLEQPEQVLQKNQINA